MKYVISDKGEVNIGGGFHIDLASDFIGKVVSAGWCEKEDGKWRVFGGSIGYRIKSKPEDAEILERFSAEENKKVV